LHHATAAELSERVAEELSEAMTTVAHTRVLLTVKEVAARLRLHPMTVRRLIRAGVLPAVQLGGKGHAVRVPEAELAGWLAKHRTRRSRTGAGGDHRL
jgi:excisionase family DNA binding protein